MEKFVTGRELPAVGLHNKTEVRTSWDNRPKNLHPLLRDVTADISHYFKESQQWQLQAFCGYPLSEEERVLACIFFSANPRKFSELLYDGQFSMGPYLDLKAAFNKKVVGEVPFYIDHPEKTINGRAVILPSRPLASFPDAQGTLNHPPRYSVSQLIFRPFYIPLPVPITISRVTLSHTEIANLMLVEVVFVDHLPSARKRLDDLQNNPLQGEQQNQTDSLYHQLQERIAQLQASEDLF